MAPAPELADRVAAFLLPPRLGPNVCRHCLNLTAGYARCYACAAGEQRLAAVVPISYSIGGEHLHRVLSDYKRDTGLLAERGARVVAAVLERFLRLHEPCVAAAAGVDGFTLVTTVPSGDRLRGGPHPLEALVARRVGCVRSRHERLLRRTSIPVPRRVFDPRRFEPIRGLEGERVLLLDDTWTTGASAESAAAALQHAGARLVAAVVIGRHLNRAWHDNDQRLSAITGGFDWSRCAVCARSSARSCAA